MARVAVEAPAVRQAAGPGREAGRLSGVGGAAGNGGGSGGASAGTGGGSGGGGASGAGGVGGGGGAGTGGGAGSGGSGGVSGAGGTGGRGRNRGERAAPPDSAERVARPESPERAARRRSGRRRAFRRQRRRRRISPTAGETSTPERNARGCSIAETPLSPGAERGATRPTGWCLWGARRSPASTRTSADSEVLRLRRDVRANGKDLYPRQHRTPDLAELAAVGGQPAIRATTRTSQLLYTDNVLGIAATSG